MGKVMTQTLQWVWSISLRDLGSVEMCPIVMTGMLALSPRRLGGGWGSITSGMWVVLKLYL